jgi:hypothetical protein
VSVWARRALGKLAVAKLANVTGYWLDGTVIPDGDACFFIPAPGFGYSG